MCLAVPGKLLSVEGSDPILRTGRVDFGGIIKVVNLTYVPEVRVGDYVLVHVGFAISTVDEAEAAQVFEYLRQMGDLAELEMESAGDTAESRADAPHLAELRPVAPLPATPRTRA